MLVKDDYRLRDIAYLLECGELDLARTKFATLETESPHDPLLQDLKKKLAAVPASHDSATPPLTNRIAYADHSLVGNLASDSRGVPGICLKLGGILCCLGIFWGKALLVFPALLRHGWNGSVVLVERSRAHLQEGLHYGRTIREYNVTAGQLFMENFVFLAVGPALLLAGAIGLALAKKQPEEP